MAFLGKISAVVTANTTDFTKKIEGTKQELMSLKRQLSGYQLNLNSRSLDGTLTKLQKFNRALQEAAKLSPFERLANGFPDLKRLADQFKLFEDVGKPLTKVKDQIEGLSNAVQAQLYPELEKTQKGFQRLFNELSTGDATFANSKKRIDNLLASLSRLGRVSSAAADIGQLTARLNASNTGASFFQPRTQEALQRSLALRGQAEQVPARLRAGVFADLSADAERNAQKIEEQAARVSKALLEIERYGRTPRRVDVLANEQQALERLTRQQEAINNQFQRELRGAQIKQVISPESESQVQSLVERFSKLSAELRSVDSTRFNGLISSVGALVEQFNRGEVSARKAKQAVDALAAASSSVNTGRALSDQSRSLLFSGSELRRQQIQRDFDRERAGGLGDAATVRRDANLTRERLNSEIIPGARELQSRAAQFGEKDLTNKANRLISLSRQISNELDKATNLAADGKSEQAASRIQKVNALLQKQSQLWQDVSERIGTLDEAKIQQDLFLQSAGRSGVQLSQGARSAASDIALGAQFRGQISDGKARIEIEAELQRLTARVLELQKALASVANSDLGSDEKIAELARLDKEIASVTAGLPGFIAERSGGTRTEQDIAAAFAAAGNQPGSVSTKRSAVVQLAAQQALFAVDDLISATGGLEYKLRAIGNNITQLGLLLGQSGVIPGLTATTGLAVGLAVVIGGQLVSAVLRWATGAKEVDQRLKALNKSLEIQKTLAQQVAQSFSAIASGLSNAGFDEAARSANELTESIKRLSQQQRDLQGRGIADTSDKSISNRQQQEGLRERIEAETRPGVRIALQRRLSQIQRQEAGLVGSLGEQGAPTAAEIRRSLVAVAEGLRRSQEEINQQFDLIPKPTALTRSAFEAELLSKTLPAGQQDQLEALNTLADRLTKIGQGQAVFGGPNAPAEEAGKALAELQKQILRLENVGKLAGFLESAADASRYLAESQSIAARAIDAGVPGAIEFQDRLRVLAKQVSDAETAISAAQQDERLTPAQRNRVISDQSAIIDRSSNERSQLFRQLSRLDRGIAVDGSSLFSDTAARARENLGAAGLGSGAAARRIRELEATRQQAQSALRVVRPDNAAEREAAARVLRATNQEIQQIEAASIALRSFSEALGRAAAEADSNFQAAQQRGDAARRNQFSFDSERNRTESSIAQRDAKNARSLRDNVDQAIADQAARLEKQSMIGQGPLAGVADGIRKAQRELDSGVASPDRQSELRQQILAGRAQIQQAAIDTQQVKDALDASTSFEELAKSAAGGRELSVTAADRAGEEVAQQISKIGAALGRQDIGQNTANDAASRVAQEQARSAAPAIFSLADSVANALLQGPSRAALQATDVSTVEGQRELNRLLRGDDSARDQNIVELEKQSQLLQGIKAAADKTAEKMGIVLNWQ